MTIIAVPRYIGAMVENHQPTTFYFACPLCGALLDVRRSKKGKPYVICAHCALQLFVRGAAGVERFDQLAYSADGRQKRAASAGPVSAPKLPRGRPRKNPDVASRVAKFSSVPPVTVLMGRVP